MVDFRLYSRLNINVDCVIFDSELVELSATILNISEGGVLLELDFTDSIKLGTILKLQGYDSFNYIDSKVSFIFEEVMKVVRIENSNDRIKVACKVSESDNSYRKYVTDKKVANYVKNYLHFDN